MDPWPRTGDMRFDDFQNQSTSSFNGFEEEYTVTFSGGPLDGGEIHTDERPNNDYFVHRFANRQYLYKYFRLTKTYFFAEFDGVLNTEGSPKQESNTRFRIYLLLLVPTLVMCGLVAWLAFG